MKTSLNIFLALLLCAGILPAQEQQSNAFSLQQAIDYALKHNATYANSELDLQSAINRKREITGLGLPQINGSVDLKDYISIPTSLIPGDFVGQPGTYLPVKFGTKYNATAGFSASQLIFNSDYIFGLRASEAFLNVSRLGIAKSKADLVAQVSKAYYSVLISNDRLKLLDVNLVNLRKRYQDTKAMVEQGFAEQIDMERLEVTLNNLISEEEKAKRSIALGELSLKLSLGMNLSDQVALTDSLRSADDLVEMPETSNGYLARPEYQLLQAQLVLNDLDLKRQKWSYAPTLAAYGSYQWNAQRNSFNFFTFDKNDPLKRWFKIGLIGATLNLNIFDGLQKHNRVQQAKITSLKTNNSIRMLELGLQMEVKSAGITYQNALVTLETQKRNMDLAQHVHDVAQKKWEAGVGSNLEVVLAQSSMLEAQSNYYIALFDATVAKIDYQKATGTLTK